MGRNDRSMITIEKKLGRPTIWQAGRTIVRISPRTGRSPKCSRRWCMAFSTTTTDESTSTPIEIAIPASDMMFVWTSAAWSTLSSPMSANDPRAAKGSVSAITNEARRWRRIRRTQNAAVRIASAIVPVTVRTAPWIKVVRS
jgi:hypothetical protein